MSIKIHFGDRILKPFLVIGLDGSVQECKEVCSESFRNRLFEKITERMRKLLDYNNHKCGQGSSRVKDHGFVDASNSFNVSLDSMLPY